MGGGWLGTVGGQLCDNWGTVVGQFGWGRWETFGCHSEASMCNMIDNRGDSWGTLGNN